MTGVRRALIVATDEYSDPQLAQLVAPAEDARALAEVLQDENVGAFGVETVMNRTCQEVEIAVARFLKSGKREETLLLHFTCHGAKDVSGELYLATKDTDMSVLDVTAIPSSWVKGAIDDSRAGLIVCLVDCCYSGAFAKGVKAGDTVDLTERLGGHGRAVITASTSLELALDGKDSPSLFTRVVVEGLRTGDADLDLDGLVSLDEFYDFVHEKVTAENPRQNPTRSFEIQGAAYIARRGVPVSARREELPARLLDSLKQGDDWERRGAVTKLAEYLATGYYGRAVAARTELQRLRDNDVNRLVQKDAADALAAAGAEAATIPEIPLYVPGPALRSPPPPPPPPKRPKPPKSQKRPKPPKPWLRRLVLPGAVALVLIIGVTVYVLTRGGALPESELLIGMDIDGAHEVVAVDVETGDTRTVTDVSDAYLPTLTHDRSEMVYLRGGSTFDRRAYLAGVDGSGPEPLVDAQATSCQQTRRPAQSLDGSKWAMACSKDGATEGLFVVGDDGMPTHIEVPESETVLGPPTWTDDEEIVFVTGTEQDGELWKVAGDGSGRATALDGVDLPSAGAPAWNPAGLLYLGRDGAGRTDVYLHDPEGMDPKLTSSGIVFAVSWSPDGSQIAFTERGETSHSLWVQDADPGAQRRQVALDGAAGALDWSGR